VDSEHLRLESAVLDGEICCLDEEGRPNFRDLLFRHLLYLNGEDLRTLLLIERKAMLKKLICRKRARMFYLDHVEGDGCLLFEQIRKMDWEGMLQKKGLRIHRTK
jgi:ATP-dependent DNA ligase